MRMMENQNNRNRKTIYIKKHSIEKSMLHKKKKGYEPVNELVERTSWTAMGEEYIWMWQVRCLKIPEQSY